MRYYYWTLPGITLPLMALVSGVAGVTATVIMAWLIVLAGVLGGLTLAILSH